MTSDNPFLKLLTPAYNFAASDIVPQDQGKGPQESSFPMEGNLKNAPKQTSPSATVSDSKLSRTEQRFSSQQQGFSEFTGAARTISGDVYTNPWEAEREPGEHRWTDSFTGRALTRLFSRGFAGTIGMTLGNVVLQHYDHHMPVGEMDRIQKSVHGLAEGMDYVFGRPIKFTLKMLGKESAVVEEIMRFRPDANFMHNEQLKALRPLYFRHRGICKVGGKDMHPEEIKSFKDLLPHEEFLSKTPRTVAEEHFENLKRELNDLSRDAFLKTHAKHFHCDLKALTPEKLELQDRYLAELRDMSPKQLAEKHFAGFTREEAPAKIEAARRGVKNMINVRDFVEKHNMYPTEELHNEALSVEEIADKYFARVFPDKTYKQLFSEHSLEKIWNSGMNMRAVNGRTYGQEMVGITLDFAMGSFFDALGRSFIAGLDPGRQKDWKDKDGHTDYLKLGKAVASSFGQAFFYNQMEDWFSAPIYAWQMRGLRKALNHHWPDFKIASDSRANNSFLLGPNMNITGTLGIPGGLDLGLRFMLYNNNTLLFRDLANHGYQKFKEWQNDHYHINLHFPDHPIDAVSHGIREMGEYLVKTFVKSQLFMLPSVLFFFPQRVAQQMHDGMFLNIGRADETGQSGILCTSPGIRPGEPYEGQGKFYRVATVTESKDGELRTSQISPTFTSQQRMLRVKNVGGKEGVAALGYPLFYESPKSELGALPEGIKRKPEWFTPGFNPYDHDFTGRTTTDRFLGRLGKWQQRSARNLYKGSKAVFDSLKEVDSLKDRGPFKGNFGDVTLLNVKMEDVTRMASNNFWAYYPYMLMKDQMARQMDNEVMDASIYRVQDGIINFNWKDFSEGTKDIWHSIWHQPVSDKTYAQSFIPRGLTNSRQDLVKREVEEQKALREKLKKTPLAAGSEAPGKPLNVIKTKEQAKDGWEPYTVAHASMQDKTRPPNVTIH